MWAWLILDNHPRTYIEDIILCVWERVYVRTSRHVCEWACLFVCIWKPGVNVGISYSIALYVFFPSPYPFELRVFHWTHLFPLPHPKSWHCRRALPCPRLWVLRLQTKVLGLHNQYFTYWAQRERTFAGRLSFSVGACLHTRDTPDMCGPCHKVFICDSSLARAY